MGSFYLSLFVLWGLLALAGWATFPGQAASSPWSG